MWAEPDCGLDLSQALLFQFFGRKGPLFRLSTVRSSVMRRICPELTDRTGLFFGWPSFPASLCSFPAPETQLLKYHIVIQSKLSQKADRLASLIKCFRLRPFGLALELRFQFFDLFDY
jgi:hypothetical protein